MDKFDPDSNSLQIGHLLRNNATIRNNTLLIWRRQQRKQHISWFHLSIQMNYKNLFINSIRLCFGEQQQEWYAQLKEVRVLPVFFLGFRSKPSFPANPTRHIASGTKYVKRLHRNKASSPSHPRTSKSPPTSYLTPLRTPSKPTAGHWGTSTATPYQLECKSSANCYKGKPLIKRTTCEVVVC